MWPHFEKWLKVEDSSWPIPERDVSFWLNCIKIFSWENGFPSCIEPFQTKGLEEGDWEMSGYDYWMRHSDVVTLEKNKLGSREGLNMLLFFWIAPGNFPFFLNTGALWYFLSKLLWALWMQTVCWGTCHTWQSSEYRTTGVAPAPCTLPSTFSCSPRRNEQDKPKDGNWLPSGSPSKTKD